MSFRSTLRIGLCLCSVAPLACAVATGEPEGDDASTAGSGGVSLGTGGSAGSPVATTAGRPGASGSSAFGGTSSGTAGKGGSASTGGKPSGTAGEGGTTSTAGKAGSSSAGGSSAGSSAAGSGTGGTGSVACGALRVWAPATSMQIKADEVIQWMGERYKATVAIDWTNAECAPDAPATWCAEWFTSDGAC